MEAERLLERWRSRQRDIIINHLPPVYLEEYENLERTIAFAEQEIAIEGSPEEGPESQEDAVPENGVPDPRRGQRIPREARKAVLIQYLQTHGPQPRGRILRETGIPNGTLGSLLNDDEFANVDGLWRIGVRS